MSPASPRGTAEQVLTVAQELGFRRNDLARSLRRRDRTETVGVVVKHASTPFFDGLIRGIDEIAAENGALVLTATTRTSDREKPTLLAMSSRRVDGLIIAPSSGDQSFLRAEQAVGVISTEANVFTVSERVNGYRTALAEASLPADGLARLECDGTTGAQQEASQLLRLPEQPTAFFCLNNVCTIGTARALRQASLGHRVALVGFDDFETADLLEPPGHGGGPGRGNDGEARRAAAVRPNQRS